MDYGNVALQAVTLQGPAPPPPLQILNPHRSENSFVFDFKTEPGKTYTVQYASELPQAEWQTLTTINGDGNTATVTDADVSASQRFYRLTAP
ncbi:MAG: hypothetical protein L0Z53_21855, partial [Acidobacteriales bacterium]|nr:hypothetical protein [Terriglobales bacterium]